MSQVSPLDRVIRRVDSDYIPHAAAERIVIIDARRRSVVPKKPLISFSDLRYYLLLTSGDVSNVAKGEINGIQLQDLSYSLPVSIAYDVRCRPGNEIRAAMALFDEAAAPAEVLERCLIRWVNELGQSGVPEFVRKYVDEPATLVSTLTAKAMNEAGLDLNILLSIDHAAALEPIVVTRDRQRTIVSDYHDEEQDLSFRILLDVDDSRKANAILQHHRNPELQNLVTREVRQFMRTAVTLQEFCTELSSATLRARLTQHLDHFLAPFGRKMGAVKLQGSVVPSIEFFAQKSVDVKCDLPPYPQPVVISNDVQMILKNVALYKAVRGLVLDDWLKEQLTRIIRERLFGAKYIEVLIDFGPFEADIKQRLKDEAAKIGYEIKQLITVPDLEPIHLKEPFTIDTAGSFDLRLPDFQVSLQVIVNTRIPNLESVKNELNRLQHVPDLMADAIVAAVRQTLHSIYPERFYMRFGYTEVAGEAAVEEELAGKITERLREKFGAEVIEVILKVGDNEIITRLRDLQKAINPFAVHVAPLNESETITFRGNFQVDMVDTEGWSRFQQLPVGVDVIREKLEEHLLAKLHALSGQAIQFRDPAHQKKIVMTLTELAERYVCSEFGLRVRISNIRRDRTEQEERANQTRLIEGRARIVARGEDIESWQSANRATRAERLARLDQLLKERTALATMGSRDELADLDREIANLRKSLEPPALPQLDDVQRKALPGPATDVSLDDFAELEELRIRPHTQPQLAGSDPE